MTSPRYNFAPPGGLPNPASGPNPLRPYYTGSDSPLQSYYNNNTLTPSLLEDDLTAQQELTPKAKEFANYGLARYGALLLSAPFDAGQTLLQVQYLPNDDIFNGDDDDLELAMAEERVREAEQRKIQDEELWRARQEEERRHQDQMWRSRMPGEGGYYDRSASPLGSSSGNYYSSDQYGQRDGYPSSRLRYEQDPSQRHYDRSPTPSSLAGSAAVRTSIYDDTTRPVYQLAPQEASSWQAIREVAKHPSEGWTSLWKGQFTNWVYEMLYLFAQPTLEATLNDTFDLYDDTIPLVHLDHVGPNIATMVTSHLVIGFILSPLELVRTRLIVQTGNPLHRKYTGMFNCITTIIQEEGVSALWGGVNMYPTLVYHTLTPLLSNSIPLIIDRVFKLSAADSPVLYALAELGLNTLDLLIRLPIETVRKRLQIQVQNKGRVSASSSSSKKYKTVVETRKRPYHGMVDCIYRVIKEEGGHHKRVSRTTRTQDGQIITTTVEDRPWYSAWGVRGLYTGLGIQLVGNLGLFAVGAVTNMQEEANDW